MNNTQYKTDIIPNDESLIRAAQSQGWEVYAYSEYAKDGTPAKAEIRKVLNLSEMAEVGHWKDCIPDNPNETLDALERSMSDNTLSILREAGQVEDY